jgi:hypothetical protein
MPPLTHSPADARRAKALCRYDTPNSPGATFGASDLERDLDLKQQRTADAPAG